MSNIYEEAKVITHEEARKNVQECYDMVVIKMTQEKVWEYERKNIETQRYIDEQQAKEERAKKVEELLELYQEQSKIIHDKRSNVTVYDETDVWFVLLDQIKQKEKELEEIK